MHSAKPVLPANALVPSVVLFLAALLAFPASVAAQSAVPPKTPPATQPNAAATAVTEPASAVTDGSAASIEAKPAALVINKNTAHGAISSIEVPIVVEENASTGAIESRDGSITIKKGASVASIRVAHAAIILESGASVVGDINAESGQITLQPGSGVIGKIIVAKPGTPKSTGMRIDIRENAGVQGGIILAYRATLCVAKGGGSGRVSGAKVLPCPNADAPKTALLQ